jgi:integrase
MARTVKHARLESRTSRSRLKRGRQPHFQTIIPGKAHIGFQCRKGDPAGRWLLRRYVGSDKYRVTTLGLADDAAPADGNNVLNYEQAAAKAMAMLGAPAGKKHRLTVKDAMELYVQHKRVLGQSVADVLSRATVHVLPALGDLVVAELTAEQLRRWLYTLSATPAQKRPKAGVTQFRPEPKDDEAVRARRASANRVLTMLKAMLNHAYDEGHVTNRDAWGRKLKPFRDVEVARIRFLSLVEAARLINACDPEFRSLVRAALETGARYGELTRLEVADFNPDVGTLHIRKSKTGKARHIVLTDEGKEFFKQHCAGRAGSELMFAHDDGSAWQKSEQGPPLREANARAKIKPPVIFHSLRHTWASLAVMAGVPLVVVAKNLGHANTAMTEKHYSHLAPSYMADEIRKNAPVYDVKPDKKVVPLR